MKHWIKYAKFEERHGYVNRARAVYERAVEFFGEVELEESLFVAFAQFEERQKEVIKCDAIAMRHFNARMRSNSI